MWLVAGFSKKFKAKGSVVYDQSWSFYQAEEMLEGVLQVEFFTPFEAILGLWMYLCYCFLVQQV